MLKKKFAKSLKQQQDISKTSIQEIKLDLEDEQDFLAIQTGKHYSCLKLKEIVSTPPKKESNSKMKTEEVCAHCNKRFVTVPNESYRF